MKECTSILARKKGHSFHISMESQQGNHELLGFLPCHMWKGPLVLYAFFMCIKAQMVSWRDTTPGVGKHFLQSETVNVRLYGPYVLSCSYSALPL